MTPLAKALNDWLESEEGIRACNASTLGSANPNWYLRNRLKRAFVAGVQAVNRNYVTEKKPSHETTAR